jgi:hypothetical protein
MRRVLACIGIAAAAFLTALPAAAADPTTVPPAEEDVPCQPVCQPVAQAKISEVATRGPAGLQDEFIEIGNPTNAPLDIGGSYIQIYSAANVSLGTIQIPFGVVLQPLDDVTPETFWTIGGTAYSGIMPLDQPFAIPFDLPVNAGVALFNPFGAKVDAVAFSTGAFSALEGTPAQAQPASLDVLEASNVRTVHLMDTENNRADFRFQYRSPDELN